MSNSNNKEFVQEAKQWEEAAVAIQEAATFHREGPEAFPEEGVQGAFRAEARGAAGLSRPAGAAALRSEGDPRLAEVIPVTSGEDRPEGDIVPRSIIVTEAGITVLIT